MQSIFGGLLKAGQAEWQQENSDNEEVQPFSPALQSLQVISHISDELGLYVMKI